MKTKLSKPPKLKQLCITFTTIRTERYIDFAQSAPSRCLFRASEAWHLQYEVRRHRVYLSGSSPPGVLWDHSLSTKVACGGATLCPAVPEIELNATRQNNRTSSLPFRGQNVLVSSLCSFILRKPMIWIYSKLRVNFAFPYNEKSKRSLGNNAQKQAMSFVSTVIAKDVFWIRGSNVMLILAVQIRA